MSVPGANGEVDVMVEGMEPLNQNASFVILIPQSREKNLGFIFERSSAPTR